VDGTLALNISNNLRVESTLLSETHISREGGVGSPLGGCAGSALLEHAVDLLERKTLGLWDEEVGIDEAENAEGTPDEEDLGTKVGLILGHHVRGDDGNDAVPEPVGGGGETDTTGTDGQREDLADNDPRTRTPGGGKEEDVDTDESNHSLDGGLGVVNSTNDGDDELADNHATRTIDEESTTTEPLNGPEGDRSGEDVDKGGDQTDQEGVGDGAKISEEGGTEVEDEVDTSPLLHHLKRGTEDRAAKIAARLEQRALEAVGPGAEVAALRDDLQFILVVGNDLGDFLLDVLRVAGLTTNTRKSSDGLVELTTLDEVTRRFWKGEKTNSKDESPKHLDGDWDTVRAGVTAVLGAIVDTRSE